MSETEFEAKRRRYRESFPILDDEVYLDHAGHAPWSIRSLEAMSRFMRSMCFGPMRPYDEWNAEVARTRDLMAGLLNADKEEIGFNYTTSLSLNLLTRCIPMDPGDNMVVPDESFPAVVMPAKLMQQWGIEARVVPSVNGLVDIDSLLGAIDGRTRMMIVSQVNFLTGQRIDVTRLAEACRNAGVFLAVDAIQAVGAIKVDVKALGCDALCFGSPKWMIGPMGVGTMYIRREMLENLRIPQVGMYSVADAWDFFNYDQPLLLEARRYECGCHNYLAHYGINPSIEMFLDLGPEHTEEYILGLAGELHDKLTSRGVDVVTPREDGARAGIVTFDPKSAGWDEADTLLKVLEVARVTVSVRMGLVRVSPHFYNNRDEIDRLLEVVFRTQDG
jgi:selenocysteine lyase/cysteine desulfurase